MTRKYLYFIDLANCSTLFSGARVLHWPSSAYEKVDAKRVPRVESKIKILSDNRSAGHNYLLSDRMEAGLVLTGTEVKSAKDGKIQLKEAYGEVAGNEAWLVNAHIGH